MEKGLIKKFTDIMKEGFIFIDNDANIRVYNKKAKEIFGLIKQYGVEHPEGKIEKGDIVIIADNSLGKDDGNLNTDILRKVGVEDSEIKQGDLFIGVGLYQDCQVSAVYQSMKQEDFKKDMTMHIDFMGKTIDACIDKNVKKIDITVDGQTFSMNYIHSIGHMVVLDKLTKKVKFYQTTGYTARGESISSLLLGSTYFAKGTGGVEFDVSGKNIFEIHEKGNTINDFYKAAMGEDIKYFDKYAEINGYPTLCTLLPIEIDGIREGAVLKVEDISALKKVISERDEALYHLNNMDKILDDNMTDYEGFSDMLGVSEGVQHVKRLAYKASKSNSTVLILGESGTGKNILAEAIHKASKKRHKPFIHVNCGAIPEHLLESELFGYEKGAFTGANTEGKIGFFEQAQGGTIFLDEIADISLSAQVKLLKVLQNKTFFRIGGTKEIAVDVRIIAATNKKLDEEVVSGKFRQDLFYRINVFPIMIPPLRERTSDIYYLANGLIKKICKRLHVEERIISAGAFQKMMEYSWPGNIRELENILELAVNLSETKIIREDQIKINNISIKGKYSEEINIIKPLKESLMEAEKKAIHEALVYFGNDKNEAMKALGMGKTSFYQKLNKYGLLNR